MTSRRGLIAGASSGLLALFASTGAAASTDQLVEAFGAIGDGRAKDTKAIQAAIDAASRLGGGRVVLSAGKTYVSGAIYLASNVELHVSAGATLELSKNVADFEDFGALICAYEAENVSITGTGRINGNDMAFVTPRPDGGFAGGQTGMGKFDPEPPHNPQSGKGRPRVIYLVKSSRIVIENVHIERAPTWTVHLLGCQDVRISGITIDNHLRVPNNDGLDIDHCRRVRVENCNINCGDDGICFKTTAAFEGWGPCEDLTVVNCHVTSASTAIKLGSAGPEPIRNVVVTGCTISGSNRGVGIQNRDGAIWENIVFSNLVIETEYHEPEWWGASEPIFITNLSRRAGQVRAGKVRNVMFANIICRSEAGIYLYGQPGDELENIVFDNVMVTIEKRNKVSGGFYDLRPSTAFPEVIKASIAAVHAEGVRGLSLRDVNIRYLGQRPDYMGSALSTVRTTGLYKENFTVDEAPY
ncbi:glycoside hydrolase family 28 protein [Asticcacaulis sp. AC402]|uniref:glycoside hydrolase family 28 protein n=1 Tax=Asticcacaulis sp. AC402 TaxID=1282361 RepID=UPI002699AB79|nr:glycosyl hydrolase family 28 protein [Asticcacaulis sp. AC402]